MGTKRGVFAVGDRYDVRLNQLEESFGDRMVALLDCLLIAQTGRSWRVAAASHQFLRLAPLVDAVATVLAEGVVSEGTTFPFCRARTSQSGDARGTRWSDHGAVEAPRVETSKFDSFRPNFADAGFSVNGDAP